MKLKLIIPLLLGVFLNFPALAKIIDQGNDSNTFNLLIELTYTKLELANKLNILKLYENKEEKTKDDFQKEEENLLCTQLFFSNDYIEFLKESNSESNSITKVRQSLEDNLMTLKKKNLRCNKDSIKETYIKELLSDLFNPKLVS